MKVTLSQAIEQLKSNSVVALPTETVYGLAARFDSDSAVQQVFNLKKRPQDNPLIIHVEDQSQIKPFASYFPSDFEQLAKAFWPGPLTVILPVKANAILPIVCAGLETVAFRVPAHPLTLQVLNAVGPLVMPSANLSGSPSSTNPEHVEHDFGKDFPVLDGGVCAKGLESTIVHFYEGRWVIVRQGSISAEVIESVLGYRPVIMQKSDRVIAPGQHYRHYAPCAKLVFERRCDEPPYILGFRERDYPTGSRVLLLGSLANPEETAENLYRVLRQLDEEGAEWAWVDLDFPQDGLWATIRERLQRAAGIH